VLAVLVLVAAAVSTASAPAAQRHRDKDCSDFSSQAAAQHYFNNHDPAHDPDLLDADGDGVACETNPCPCSHAGPGGGGGHQHADPVKRDRATVSYVTDGDTIHVRLRHHDETIRLIGIDTPEVYGGVECGGEEASKSMKRALQPGDRVKLISDPSQDNRDRYHRLLRYVEHEGTDMGRRQIRHGWANVYVYGGNPFRRVRAYRRAESKARRDGIGVFAACDGRFHHQI
jgi:endonuclease YncB( thermonuclease family)